MTDDPAKLLSADPDEVRLALSIALQRDGHRRFRHGDDLVAKPGAGHFVRYLKERNYVVREATKTWAHHIDWNAIGPKLSLNTVTSNGVIRTTP
jgi:hypothetical protein